MEKKKNTVPEIAPEVREAEEKAIVNALVAKVKAAQEIFANYTQEQVDKIFQAASLAANNMRIPLAQMAVEETGMGVLEDKIIKNHYAPSTSATNICP
jgi:acetaldehyde dehydrogenase/alcohol dehydrogenase